MTKQDICYEIILQFRQYIFWDYTTIEVYDSGPEYGLIFFSKKNNRKISFNIGCWENQANFFIEIEKIKTPFFQLVGMNESNKLLIQQKYDDYNKSYKIRNVLIISYAVVWLYSQIDLLFFSNGEQNSNGKLSQLYNFSFTPSPLSALQINFRVPL